MTPTLTRCLLPAAVLLVLLITSGAIAQDAPVTTVRVASGLVRPIYVTHAPGDTSRIFIIEKQGRIRILKGSTLLTTPFLDIDPLVTGGTTDFSEQGLLGLAFDPNYATNGFFYVNYTNLSGDTVVARYSVSANPDVANTTATQIMLVDQPFDNHNGGWIEFGPDGYLYVALGDGGSANDPGNRAQTISNMLLGKILRIDPSRTATPGYSIPPTNPFVGVPGDDEIWAYGLRNPWRPSFDRQTGDLWIADVGQAALEEANFQPATDSAGANGGRNYGWRCMEGTSCTGMTGCTCNGPTLTLPIHQYTHSDGCSITGGYVYRGSALPEFDGVYFFADYCAATIWSFKYEGATLTDFTDRTASLAPGGGLSINGITSFGQDAAGELYICDQSGGEVFKMVRNTPSAAKLTPDNSPFNLRGMIVTGVFGDAFYLEDEGRTSGIRVQRTGHGLSLWQQADATGLVKTDSAGERYIEATAVSGGAITAGIAPLGMTNRSVGGDDLAYNAVTGAGQQGVLNGTGLNNVGLLVTSWGTVSGVDPTVPAAWFTVDDGSEVDLKVALPAGVSAPQPGFVRVTGISSVEKPGSTPVRLLKVRQPGDIRPF